MEDAPSNVIRIKDYKKSKKRDAELLLGPDTYTREAASATWKILKIRADKNRKTWEKVVLEGGTRAEFLIKSPGLLAYTMINYARGKEGLMYGVGGKVGENLHRHGVWATGFALGTLTFGNLVPFIVGATGYGMYKGLENEAGNVPFQVPKK